MFERRGWHRATPLCADTTVGVLLIIYFDDVINVIVVLKRIKNCDRDVDLHYGPVNVSSQIKHALSLLGITILRQARCCQPRIFNACWHLYPTFANCSFLMWQIHKLRAINLHTVTYFWQVCIVIKVIWIFVEIKKMAASWNVYLACGWMFIFNETFELGFSNLARIL